LIIKQALQNPVRFSNSAWLPRSILKFGKEPAHSRRSKRQ